MSIRLAYLNSRYPSLSHTFIEREVRAVRARGIEVHTFTANAPDAQDALGDRHAAEARETFVLKTAMRELLRDQVRAIARWPGGYLRALGECQRLFGVGARARATTAGYLMEAARLALEMDARGLSHVHVHMANNGAAIALLACTINPELSYSLTVHGPAEFFDVHRLNLAEKVRRAVFVRCISEFCRSQVMAWSDPGRWDHLHIVHCAVDPEALRPGPARDADGSLRLLSVGRLDAVKGFPVLLDALAQVRREGVDATLEIVGAGALDQSLKARSRELGLEAWIAFTGAVSQEDMPGVFERNDAFVLASFMEGVPVVLMEAMAKGLPVIATRVAGVPELVRDGRTGFLVPPGSVSALAQAIVGLARGRRELDGLRAAAREVVVREFSVQVQGPQMEALFRRYLAHAGAPSS